MESDRSFPSKVLLLGEYAAITGGESIAIPWSYFEGRWMKHKIQDDHKKILKSFREHLEAQENHFLYFDEWKQDFKKDLIFHSTIPIGYGVGSSGALVAGIFHRYAKDQHLTLEELKDVFIEMESFFHGTSSGIDPLVSYLQRGILIKKGDLQIFDYEDISILDHIYLWDTKKSRETKPLVEWYRTKLQDDHFKSMIEDQFIPANSKALEALMTDDVRQWESAFINISEIQRQYFEPMIPEEIAKHWDLISNTPDVHIKLCGAGGGGFYLLYAKNKEIIENLKSELPGVILPYKD